MGLGAQRGDVAATCALWALQDNLALMPDEGEVIKLKRDFVAGQERVIWNPTLAFPPKRIRPHRGRNRARQIRPEDWEGYNVDADSL